MKHFIISTLMLLSLASTVFAQHFTITNTGLVSGTLGTFTSSDPTNFPISNNTCGTSLLPSTTCGFDVNFVPTTTGSKTANITDGTYSTTVGGLTGTYVPLTYSATSTSNIVFDNTSTNKPHTLPVTVNNTGTGIIITRTPTFTGTDAGLFSTNKHCESGTVTSSNSCTENVVFTPNVSGTFSATMHIPYNGGTNDVGVSGTGVLVDPYAVVVCNDFSCADTTSILSCATPSTFCPSPTAFTTQTATTSIASVTNNAYIDDYTVGSSTSAYLTKTLPFYPYLSTRFDFSLSSLNITTGPSLLTIQDNAGKTLFYVGLFYPAVGDVRLRMTTYDGNNVATPHLFNYNLVAGDVYNIRVDAKVSTNASTGLPDNTATNGSYTFTVTHNGTSTILGTYGGLSTDNTYAKVLFGVQGGQSESGIFKFDNLWIGGHI